MKELTKEEVVEFLDDSDLSNQTEELNFVDLIKKTKILISFWADINTSLIRTREGYKLSTKWKDDKLQEKFIEEGKPLIMKLRTIEEDVFPLLDEIKKNGLDRFFSKEEIDLLPKSMKSRLI